MLRCAAAGWGTAWRYCGAGRCWGRWSWEERTTSRWGAPPPTTSSWTTPPPPGEGGALGVAVVVVVEAPMTELFSPQGWFVGLFVLCDMGVFKRLAGRQCLTRAVYHAAAVTNPPANRPLQAARGDPVPGGGGGRGRVSVRPRQHPRRLPEQEARGRREARPAEVCTGAEVVMANRGPCRLRDAAAAPHPHLGQLPWGSPLLQYLLVVHNESIN